MKISLEQKPVTYEAADRFELFGDLGVTAADHKTIGSSLDENSLLLENPGQTLGEILTIDELKELMQKRLADLDYLRARFGETNPQLINEQVENITKSIAYLESLGKWGHSEAA